jgi:integrase
MFTPFLLLMAAGVGFRLTLSWILRAKFNLDLAISLLLNTNDRVLHSALLFCLLTGMRSGEACGLLAEDVSTKGNLGRFVQIRPNHLRQLKSNAAERVVPLNPVLEQLLDQRLPNSGRLFPSLTVDRVVKRYA